MLLTASNRALGGSHGRSSTAYRNPLGVKSHFMLRVRKRLTSLLGVPLLLAVTISGCNWEELAEEEALPIPQDAAEVRAEMLINSYIEALVENDWDSACGYLAVRGMKQIFTAGASAKQRRTVRRLARDTMIEGCPVLLATSFSGTDFPRVHIEPISVSRAGDEIEVESDQGTFRMTENYKLSRFPQ